MDGKANNWGGKRQGSGRKTANLSQKETYSLVKAFHRKAKETGKCVGDLLADIAYDLGEKTRHRMKAAEIYLQITTVKHTHQTVEKIEGPQILLPPMNPKPMPPHELTTEETEHRVH